MIELDDGMTVTGRDLTVMVAFMVAVLAAFYVGLRLCLSVIASNLGNHWRRLVLPRGIGNWPLTSLQQRLVKTGGWRVEHVRYYWLLLAEGHLSRRLFGSMLRMNAAPPLPNG